MARYLNINLTVEIDDNLPEEIIDQIANIIPPARLSSSENIILDGRQVVLDWGSLEIGDSFTWANVENMRLE